MPLPQTAKSLGLVVLLLFLPVSAASALTAEEVWADWQRLAKDGGMEITARTRREGDRLVVTDIAIPVGPPDDLADLKLARIDLQDRPDGTVAVLLPPEFPVTLVPRETDPEFDLVTLTASAPGFSMVISGIGEQAAVDLSAPSLALSLERIVPALGVDEQVDFNLAVADLAFQHKMDLTAAARTVAASLRLGTLHGDMLVDVDARQETTAMSVDLSKVAGMLEFVLPPSLLETEAKGGTEEENFLPEMLEVLGDGLVMKAELSHGPFTIQVDMKSADHQARTEIASASGHSKVGFDAAAIAYDIAMGKTSLINEGILPGMEYPNIRMGFAELAYGVSIGIGDLTIPQEARLSARLIDLTLPPEIWATADPTGALDATPLSFGANLSMRYALGPEMLDPNWQPEPDKFPPMDIVEFALKELSVAGFGITFGGNGSLAFDESDLETYEGIPAPEGKVAFQATGVNALIDRIEKAGLVTGEELTGLRFGLAFIARVGETPDSLVSNIEFRDKSLYLNGQKIR